MMEVDSHSRPFLFSLVIPIPMGFPLGMGMGFPWTSVLQNYIKLKSWIHGLQSLHLENVCLFFLPVRLNFVLLSVFRTGTWYNMGSKHAGIVTCVLTSPIGDLQLTCCKKGVHRLTLPELSSSTRFKPDLRFVCFCITMWLITIQLSACGVGLWQSPLIVLQTLQTT